VIQSDWISNPSAFAVAPRVHGSLPHLGFGSTRASTIWAAEDDFPMEEFGEDVEPRRVRVFSSATDLRHSSLPTHNSHSLIGSNETVVAHNNMPLQHSTIRVAPPGCILIGLKLLNFGS